MAFASDTLYARQSTIFQFPTFLVKYDASGNEVWARQSIGDSSDLAMSIACDSSGGIYFTGLFNSTSLRLGSLPPVMNNGFFDVFTVKYDANGNAIWCASSGNTDDDRANDIAIDNSGNVVVAGSFRSNSIVFGSFTLNNPGGLYDSFILKYGSNGNVIWAVNDCYAEADLGISLCIGASNTIWMTGIFTTDSLVFGTDTFSNSNNLYMEIYLVKRDSAGNYMYSTTLAGPGDDQGNHLASDVNGDIYLSGYYWNTLDVGPYQLTHGGSGGPQIFIAKIGGLTDIPESCVHKNLLGYPNPVAEYITLTGADFNSDGELQLLNAYGQVIGQPIVINRSSVAVQINTSGLASGMYFVEMKTRNQIYFFQFMKE